MPHSVQNSKTLNIRDFIPKESEHGGPTPSAHEVRVYYKLATVNDQHHADFKGQMVRGNEKESAIPYYLKIYSKDEIGKAKEEAFLGELYRFLIGKQAPETYILVDENDEVIGNISEGLIDFVGLDKQQPDENRLVEAGLGNVIGACHVLAEGDLHLGNIGMSGERVCKIDHDHTAEEIISELEQGYSLSVSYSNFSLSNASKIFDPSAMLLPSIKDRFPITMRDIEGSPIMTDARPRYWFCHKLSLKDGKKSYFESEKSLISDKRYARDYFGTLVKFIIIHNSNIESKLAGSYKLDEDRIIKYSQFFENRCQKFKELLPKSKKFHDFINKNPIIFNKILIELEEYNARYSYLNIQDAIKSMRQIYLETQKNKLLADMISIISGIEYARSDKIIKDDIRQFNLRIHEYFTNDDSTLKSIKSLREDCEKIITEIKSKCIFKRINPPNYVETLSEIYKSISSLIINEDKKFVIPQDNDVTSQDWEDDISTSDYNIDGSYVAQGIFDWINEDKNTEVLLQVFNDSVNEYQGSSIQEAPLTVTRGWLRSKIGSFAPTYVKPPRKFDTHWSDLQKNNDKAQVIYSLLFGDDNYEWNENSFNTIFIKKIASKIHRSTIDNLKSFSDLCDTEGSHSIIEFIPVMGNLNLFIAKNDVRDSFKNKFYTLMEENCSVEKRSGMRK